MSDAERRDHLPLGPRLARLVAPEAATDHVRLHPALPGVPPLAEPKPAWPPTSDAAEEGPGHSAQVDAPVTDPEPARRTERPEISTSEPAEETLEPVAPRADPDDAPDPEPVSNAAPPGHAAESTPGTPDGMLEIKRQTVIVPILREVPGPAAPTPPSDSVAPPLQAQWPRSGAPSPPPDAAPPESEQPRTAEPISAAAPEPRTAQDMGPDTPAPIRVTLELPGTPEDPAPKPPTRVVEGDASEGSTPLASKPATTSDPERLTPRIVPVAAEDPVRDTAPAPRRAPEEAPAPRPDVRLEIGAVNISLRPPEPQRTRPALSVTRRAPRAHAIPLSGFGED